MTNLETLKQQTADLEAKLEEMKAEIERLENGWEMKCPYEEGDEYYLLDDSGSDYKFEWDGRSVDKKRFSQGNAFQTKEAAELESKRRNLLTRFKAFRDECNNGWEPDWKDFEMKWDINYKQGEGLRELCSNNVNSFSTFGYFKNKKDAERAIELFGDEIKELFVECEAQ